MGDGSGKEKGEGLTSPAFVTQISLMMENPTDAQIIFFYLFFFFALAYNITTISIIYSPNTQRGVIKLPPSASFSSARQSVCAGPPTPRFAARGRCRLHRGVVLKTLFVLTGGAQPPPDAPCSSPGVSQKPLLRRRTLPEEPLLPTPPTSDMSFQYPQAYRDEAVVSPSVLIVSMLARLTGCH